MGHWINLDRGVRTPLPALCARRGCNWPRERMERGRGRGGALLRDAGRNGTGGTRKGGVPWR